MSTTIERTPPMVPSLILRYAWKRWAEATRRAGLPKQAAHLGILAFGLLAFGPLLAARTAPGLALLVALVGGRRVWRTRAGLDVRVGLHGSPRHLTALTALGVLVPLLLIGLGRPVLAALLALGAIEYLGRPPKGTPTASWWAHANIGKALVASRICSSPGKDSDGVVLLPKIGYRGKPVRIPDVGMQVTIRLPQGNVWTQAVSKHDTLASAMRLPIQRLHLEHNDEHDACDLTITVLDPQAKSTTVAVLPEQTVWADGVPIGPDRMGRPVVLQTVGAHTAFCAQTGAGKTRLAAYGLAHALLDPTVYLFVIDGKHDLEDYPVGHLCQSFVGGATHASARQVEEVFLTLERVSAHRGTQGREHAPILVIIDEWARIRSAANRHDPALAKRLDSLLIELAATVRSRGISIWVLAQRGTAEFIPTDLRANLAQRCVGQTYEEAEVRYILDRTPEVLPSRPGQFLFGSDRHTAALAQVPMFDDAAFAEVIKRATVLRQDMPLPPIEDAGVDLVKAAVPVPRSPLEVAVHEVLQDGPRSASDLFLDLPEWLRTTSVRTLGKALQMVDGVESGWSGSTRVWRRVTSVDALSDVGDTPQTEVTDIRDRLSHAQTPPQPDVTSVTSDLAVEDF